MLGRRRVHVEGEGGQHHRHHRQHHQHRLQRDGLQPQAGSAGEADGVRASAAGDGDRAGREEGEDAAGVAVPGGRGDGAAGDVDGGVLRHHHGLRAVGAGAVVTKDVEAYAVVVGNPAKVIRMLGND